MSTDKFYAYCIQSDKISKMWLTEGSVAQILILKPECRVIRADNNQQAELDKTRDNIVWRTLETANY